MSKGTVMIGGKDRCDYRRMSTRELVEEAKYYPNIELCIALGERLEHREAMRWTECDECGHEFKV